MSKILVLGGTGSLGRHIVERALEDQHEVTILARDLSNLPESIEGRVKTLELDVLASAPDRLAELFRQFEVVIQSAGNVAHEKRFVDLFDRVVTGLALVSPPKRPVAWFVAGVALLDLGDTGLRGLDLSMLHRPYWPHLANFERLRRTTLDWRLLCPGPMTEEQPRGLAQMRVSLDRLPLDVPEDLASWPETEILRFFSAHLPAMVVPYRDAADLILDHVTAWDKTSGHRIGLALPTEGVRP